MSERERIKRLIAQFGFIDTDGSEVPAAAHALAKIWSGTEKLETYSEPLTCDLCIAQGKSDCDALIKPGAMFYNVDGVVVGIEHEDDRPSHIKPSRTGQR